MLIGLEGDVLKDCRRKKAFDLEGTHREREKRQVDRGVCQERIDQVRSGQVRSDSLRSRLRFESLPPFGDLCRQIVPGKNKYGSGKILAW